MTNPQLKDFLDNFLHRVPHQSISKKISKKLANLLVLKLDMPIWGQTDTPMHYPIHKAIRKENE